MADVARVAGVHQTTVSRALRNDPRITTPVKRRVRRAAEIVGYIPNPLFSALGALRRHRADLINQPVIGYIRRAPIARDPGVTKIDYVPTPHLAGAREATEHRGYLLEDFVIDNEMSEKRLNQILVARNITGVLIGPLPEAHSHFKLDWNRLCSVAIDYSFKSPFLDRVVTDSYASMNMVINECLNRGFRRIGIVLSTCSNERNEGLFCAAYALALQQNRLLAKIPPLIFPKWDSASFASWMQRHRPNVIVSSNLMLSYLENWLLHNKISIPSDIGLINLNVYPGIHTHAGIFQDAGFIGKVAANLLIDKIIRNERGIPSSRVSLLSKVHWHDGPTLKKAVP